MIPRSLLANWIPVICLPVLAWASAALASPAFEFATASSISRAADLVGRVVETRDGEELGKVKDFAVDLASGRIAYVVVSVGSFLIEDSLIAVEPGALRHSADADGRLVLETRADNLRTARRFGPDGWPLRADVAAAEPEDAPVEEADDRPAGEAVETASRGTASISDGTKTATLSAGERSIRMIQPPPEKISQQPATPPAKGQPMTRFDRLDKNGDGVLNRAEIAHELTRRDRYHDIDQNQDGSIQRSEFDDLVQRREPPG